jgi:hypothetical protein
MHMRKKKDKVNNLNMLWNIFFLLIPACIQNLLREIIILCGPFYVDFIIVQDYFLYQKIFGLKY